MSNLKLKINLPYKVFTKPLCLLGCLFLLQTNLYAQDSTAVVKEKATPPAKTKPVKNTFQSDVIIDNQTVMVSPKGTLEMTIMHRFGTVDKGYDDFWGLFANSNIRIGMNYVPINNLDIGFGITKTNMLWDVNAKYALLKQTKGKFPVSISYYGNLAIDTRQNANGDLFAHTSDRILSFNQIIIGRKITDKLSLQVAPSISHQNSVTGFYTKNDSSGTSIFKNMKHDHFALAMSGRYKVTETMSVIANYDQPLTRHATNNPTPNMAFGFEFNTSGHTFQLFMGNYAKLNPQSNNLYNTNSPFNYTQADGTKVKGGKFLIGFNVTRLWN